MFVFPWIMYIMFLLTGMQLSMNILIVTFFKIDYSDLQKFDFFIWKYGNMISLILA